MSDNSKIIKFPRISPAQSTLSDDYDDEFDDFEDWEPYAELLEKEDYPGLVKYCEQRAVQRPDDLYAQYYLGDACYKFLKPKRKPRSITEIYLKFVPKGYLLFTEKDLLNALLRDERFIIEYPYEDSLYAEARVARKRRK